MRKVPTVDDDVLYGTSHAAAMLGCDSTTLRDYAKRGIAKPLRTSTGRHLWRLADLRAVQDWRAANDRPFFAPRPAALDR
jgi:hypothetical protein